MIIIAFLGEQNDFPIIESQLNETITSKYDELEKEDEEQSSATEPTAIEIVKNEQSIGKDTDEDASFSESEPISSKSFMSDEQQQPLSRSQIIEESRPSSLISTNEMHDNHEIISKTTESQQYEQKAPDHEQIPSLSTQITP